MREQNSNAADTVLRFVMAFRTLDHRVSLPVAHPAPAHERKEFPMARVMQLRLASHRFS